MRNPMTSATLGLLLASAASAAAGPRTMSISGSGRTRVKPDRASMTIHIRELAPTAEKAVKDNADRVAQVKAALGPVLTKGRKTARGRITTESFSQGPEYEWKNNKQVFKGYGVNHTLRVSVNSTRSALLGSLVDAANTVKIDNLQGPSTEVSSTRMAKANDRALRNAVRDAKRQASVTAGAAGLKVGRVLSIAPAAQESAPIRRYFGARAMAAESAPANTEIAIDKTDVTANVAVTFALK